VSTQIIDAVLNMAPNNQKTKVVPPAEVREDCPLIQKSYSLVLFVLAVLAAAHVVSEIVGGFTRVTWLRWRQRQLSTNITGGSLNEAGQCCGEHRYWRSLS
jgi:hypothetical protein